MKDMGIDETRSIIKYPFRYQHAFVIVPCKEVDADLHQKPDVHKELIVLKPVGSLIVKRYYEWYIERYEQQ